MVFLLSSVPEFEVVGEATTGEEAVTRAAELRPDVILMDLQMPEVNGIEATKRIMQDSPSVRILVVTLFEDDDSVFAALRAGARGYVLKDADEEEMILSIRAVSRGEAIFSPAIAERVLAYFASPMPAPPRAFPTLTDREREILNLHRPGTPQPFHRETTVSQHQDSRQLRLKHLHQAASRRPCPGHHPGPRSRTWMI